jgi:UDP-glucose 4-epimerase
MHWKRVRSKKSFSPAALRSMGSSAVPATEETPPHPSSFYGISKQRAEEHVKRLFNRFPTIIVRCGNVYGYSKSMRFDAVINRFMFDANFVNRITINGSGNQSRAFIHINKVTKMLAALLRAEVPSGIYNLSDRNFEIVEIIEVLKKIYPDLEYLFINQHITMQELRSKNRVAIFLHAASCFNTGRRAERI